MIDGILNGGPAHSFTFYPYLGLNLIGLGMSRCMECRGAGWEKLVLPFLIMFLGPLRTKLAWAGPLSLYGLLNVEALALPLDKLCYAFYL